MIWLQKTLRAPFVIRLLMSKGVTFMTIEKDAATIGRPLQTAADCMVACVWERALPDAGRLPADDATVGIAELMQHAAAWAVDVENTDGAVYAAKNAANVAPLVVGEHFADTLATVVRLCSPKSELAQTFLWHALKMELVARYLIGQEAIISGSVAVNVAALLLRFCDCCMLYVICDCRRNTSCLGFRTVAFRSRVEKAETADRKKVLYRPTMNPDGFVTVCGEGVRGLTIFKVEHKPADVSAWDSLDLYVRVW
jgi:hypothetical protein